MPTAKQGDKVRVHYTGTLQDDTQFDSSRERDPLEFEIGAGRVIPGFEQAVVGMSVGDTKKVDVESSQAYGPRRPELMVTVDRGDLPEGMNPQVGQQLQMQRSDGHSVVVVVADTTDQNITVDANHPLAGHDLRFEIELVDIVSA